MVAHRGVMTVWEINLFDHIYSWPSALKPLMLFITQAGSSWMIAIVTTYLFYKKRRSLAVQVMIVGLSTYVVVEIAKRLVARPRPYSLLPYVHAREPMVSGYGFPSGHTAAITAVALLLYHFTPKNHRYLAFVWIGLVGLSRIYLGVHAPLDVVGGFCLGFMVLQLFLLTRPSLVKWSKHLK